MKMKVKKGKAKTVFIAFLLFSSIIFFLFYFLKQGKTIPEEVKIIPVPEKARKENSVPIKKEETLFLKKNRNIVKSTPIDTSQRPVEESAFKHPDTTPNKTFENSVTSDLNLSRFFEPTGKKIPEYHASKSEELSFFEPAQITNIAFTGVNDFWSLVKRPFEMDKQDSYLLLSAIGGTLALTQLDEVIHNEIIKHPSIVSNKFTSFGDWYGTTNTTYTVSLSLASLGIIFREKNLVQTGLEVFESYFVANTITSFLKRSFGRARPFTEKGNSYFTPFSSAPNGDNAFPSGHATLAFSLSTVLASHVDNTYYKILIFTPAVVTAVSRVMQNMHWTSDIFMGSAIGYFVGTFVTNNHSKFIPENMLIVFDQFGNIGFTLKF